MAVAGIGQGVDMLSSLLGTSGASDASSTAKNDPAAAAKAKADAAKAAQKAMLDQIRQKGVYAWAQEQKLEKLKEKVRAEVMSERGMDDASLAKLPDDQRASAAKSIEEEIAERIKEALRKELEGKAQADQKAGKPPTPMIIDVSV